MSYRTRIRRVFFLYACFISLLFSLLLEGLPHLVEDEISRNMLAREVNSFVDCYSIKNVMCPLPNSYEIQAFYAGDEQLPSWASNLPAGNYEDESYHLRVVKLDDGKIVYVFYDESRTFLEQNETLLNLSIAAIAIFVVIIGYIASVRLSENIASPIELLSQEVKDTRNTLSSSQIFLRDDELGDLARSFDEALQRIHKYGEREKDFTRYASHELRTPLTIFRNNLELLDAAEGNEKISLKARERLKDSLETMENQVRIFLHLAREKNICEEAGYIDVTQELRNVLANHSQLSLEIILEDKVNLKVDITVFSAIADNLLRNITQHGSFDKQGLEGRIELTAQRLTVSNPIAEMQKESAHKTFGLEIVEKLCELNQWPCKVIQQENIFIVEIDFPEDSHPA